MPRATAGDVVQEGRRAYGPRVHMRRAGEALRHVRGRGAVPHGALRRARRAQKREADAVRELGPGQDA